VANKALADLERRGRVVMVDGDREILPGVELLHVPGHTLGIQAVAVNSAKGTAVLVSDCAHFRRNFEEDTPSVFITDMVAWMESYDKLRAKAPIDLLFPGHDQELFTKYPLVAEGVTGLA
jgi:glyoxylase-like metal-dependent hydrolase (beta-lactamase superfamily II)